MSVEAKPQDAERLVVDYLTGLLDPDEVTVGVGVPDRWKVTDAPHVEVASDGEPFAQWPIVTYATIRLVAHARSTTVAKSWCATALGMLLAHPGDPAGIANTRFLTGVLPARDPDTHAELAAATVRVSVRTTDLDSGS